MKIILFFLFLDTQKCLILYICSKLITILYRSTIELRKIKKFRTQATKVKTLNATVSLAL